MNKIISISKLVYIVLMSIIALIICAGSVGFSYFTLIAFGTFLSLILLFIAISRRIVLSIGIASACIIILQLLNQLKVHYYKERMFFPDVYIAVDPQNLSTLLHYPSALLLLSLLLLFFVFTIFLFRKEKKVRRLSQFATLIGAVVIFMAILQLSRQDKLNEAWQTHLPKGRGTIANLFISASQLTYSPPHYQQNADYFIEQVNKLNINQNSSDIEIDKKPDIVVFLQESTVNPQLFATDSPNMPSYDMFKQQNSNLMRVQTFGGGTWLTEFSILTGLNTNDFGSRKNAAYYAVAPHVQTSLFNELNNNGYMTIVLSPMGYGNYNAGPSYTHFGMQQFLMPQDLGYPADKTENLWKIPTQTLLNNVKQVMATYTDKPLFIFVLSMFEHGPYQEHTDDVYQLSSHMPNQAVTGKFNDYLQKIEQLNLATLDFIDYVEQRERPTLFVYFGDHQPSLGWSGAYNAPLPSGDFITQYTIVGNYPLSIDHNSITDTSLVSGLILEKAGISDLSPFYQANIAMRYLCDGQLDDCQDKTLVDSYKHYIYQVLENAGQATKK